MDLSQFKPPVRLSMTDEEIYQALGSAQASEDGIAKAMAIVEEQANLREHDNKLFAEWLNTMQTSEAPEAKIALENIERAKQGFEALPLEVQSTPITHEPATTIAEASPVVEQVVEIEPELEFEEEQLQSIFANPIAEPQSAVKQVELSEVVLVDEVNEAPLEPNALDDAFDNLLAEAATEATTSISLNPPQSESAVTFDEDEPSPSNFEVSADEDALVAEEASKAKVKSNWWSNSAFWVLVSGVFLPVVASYLAVVAGFSFGTAVTGFFVGSALNLGLAVSAHFTSKRTIEPVVVTTRATFGVFGAFIPGFFAIGFAIVALNLVSLGATASFDGVFETSVSFSDEVFAGLSLATLLPIALVVLALMIAGFASRAMKWMNAASAGLLVLAFFVGALITRPQLSLDSIDYSIDFAQLLLLAGSLVSIGFATFGKAPRIFATPASRLNTASRWSALVFVIIALPMAVFAHFTLVFAQSKPVDGFSLLQPFGLTQLPELATAVLWVTAIALFVLLVNLGQVVLEQLRAFGINQLRGWFAIVASLTATTLWIMPEWSNWLDGAKILIVPVAAAAGFGVADSLIRRGSYHEASLLRGYGFYGKFNVIGVVGYCVVVAFGLSISQPLESATWLGFSGWASSFAPLFTFGAALVLAVVTGIPRIRVQQREVAEVELRKASLTEFTGFSE